MEDELSDKEERLRAAVATRQEFAGQLVAAQQRELTFLAENAKLTEENVSYRRPWSVHLNYDRLRRMNFAQEKLSNDLDVERAKTSRLEETIERTNVESAVDKEKHFKHGFFAAKNLVSLKEEGASTFAS